MPVHFSKVSSNSCKSFVFGANLKVGLLDQRPNFLQRDWHPRGLLLTSDLSKLKLLFALLSLSSLSSSSSSSSVLSVSDARHLSAMGTKELPPLSSVLNLSSPL